MPKAKTEDQSQALANMPTPGTTALDALPDDIKADLLREQMESMDSIQRLPRMKILPAGVGYFEFEDTPGDTIKEFLAVIVGHHKRNVLWDKKFGGHEHVPEDESGPACSSPDGIHGIPRAGFKHEGLPEGMKVADGFTMVACGTCPYNRWGTGNKLITSNSPKGKAVTNQRSIYLLTEGRMLPTELILPPTSLPPFDQYMVSMANRGTPLPAVLTKLTQEIVVTKNGTRYAKCKFSMERLLNVEEFANVQEKRQQFRNAMTTTAQQQVQAEMAKAESTIALVEDDEEGDEDTPF